MSPPDFEAQAREIETLRADLSRAYRSLAGANATLAKVQVYRDAVSAALADDTDVSRMKAAIARATLELDGVDVDAFLVRVRETTR